MPSFDIVSEVDAHELANAVDQAKRELENRFDFRGSGATFELSDFVVTISAPSDFQVRQMMPILTEKLARRRVDVGAMQPEEPEVALHKTQQKIVMRNGIDSDHARKIVKTIKESKLKVQVSIQGEQVRVTGKKRDDLQSVMQLLKKADLGLPLQFTNFRE
ncbi:MAG TPA: YajQ family cyclic di-GMP-binding protein [Gammaproteobacteria bacterium]|nr:YajQ family cyclic di-GMP-binding protein [Gammaproteobacteria bacterium]